MATCSPQELLSTQFAACLNCVAGQWNLIRLSLLCAIANGETLATCDVAALIASAKCFECLSPGEQQIVELQLLCQIAQNGGGGGSVDCDPITGRMDALGTGQHVTAATFYIPVEYNTEIFDTDNMIDLGADNRIITIPENGKYLIVSTIRLTMEDDPPAGGLNSSMFKNGNIGDAAGSTLLDYQSTIVTSVQNAFTFVQVVAVEVVAGDYIWMGLDQGAAVDVVIGNASLSAFKIVGCQASA